MPCRVRARRSEAPAVRRRAQPPLRPQGPRACAAGSPARCSPAASTPGQRRGRSSWPARGTRQGSRQVLGAVERSSGSYLCTCSLGYHLCLGCGRLQATKVVQTCITWSQHSCRLESIHSSHVACSLDFLPPAPLLFMKACECMGSLCCLHSQRLETLNAHCQSGW